MKREEVYKVIDSERDYQELMKKNHDSHVVEDFPLGSAITAIEYNLNELKNKWYTDKHPYKKETLNYIRKIAGICVQMGEKYNLPNR
jgi:hypothetical protein